jgi:hypothetical protein
MFTFRFLSVAILITAVQAIPWSTPEKRNPCDGKDAEPILYHEYRQDVCPPKKHFDDAGNCEMEVRNEGSFFLKQKTCSNFCEVRTNFYYGREHIFLSNAYCHGPMTCTITETHTTQFASGWTVSPSTLKINNAWTASVSRTWTTTKSVAHANARAMKLEQNQCGYFTFLPIMTGSWYV